MISTLTFVRGVLFLDDATLQAHANSRDALKRGLLILVVVVLLSGLPSLVRAIIGGFNPPDQAALANVQQQIHQLTQLMPIWPDAQSQRYFEGSLDEGLKIGLDIAQLPSNLTFLPDWLGNVLRAIGVWLSRPLGWLGAWAWYALWVLLVARLLGGHATLERMWSVSLLFVVPHIFDVLGDLLGVMGRLPGLGACLGGLGGLLGLVTAVWGVMVYIKATAVANEFDLGRATLATLLPAVVAALAALAVGVVLFVVTGVTLGPMLGGTP